MEPYCYKCQKNASCNDPQCPNQAYHYQKEGEEKEKEEQKKRKKT